LRKIINSLIPFLSLCFLIFSHSSCASLSSFYSNKSSLTHYQPLETGRARESFLAASNQGMVVAGHPLASQAGAAMLKAGGNAIDAMVAASFAISVVRPHSTGIGGGGFLIFHQKSSGKSLAFDFRERAPLQASETMYLDQKGEIKQRRYRGHTITAPSQEGHLAVATPGLVAGLVEMQEKYGSLPLATVMQPAIQIAERGFLVYPSLADAIEQNKEALGQYEGSKALLFPGGRQLKVGDTLKQLELAQSLKLIAKGGKAPFYQGEIRQKILAEIKAGQGILQQKDFTSYRVLQRPVVASTYRGHTIIGMPPPSSGGVHIAQMLHMLSADKVSAHAHNSPEAIHLLTEVMRRAFADRAAFLGDPDFVEVPMQKLLSPTYAANLRQGIDPSKASPSSTIRPGGAAKPESRSTTHISVVDKDGNAASSTQTINTSFGSKVLARGTGIFLNNEMDDFSIRPGVPNAFGLVGGKANAIAPRKTMLSSMSPTIVLDPAKNVRLVLGSPGGPMIINATLQTIINTIDYKMPLADAVHAYRIHHQWLPDTLFLEENGFASKTHDQLKKMGHTVSTRPRIGDVQAIANEGGQWIGVSDTRQEGQPAAP